MARPRWTIPASRASWRWQRGWDRFVALWASLNLLLVVFDLSYVQLRTFWLQRVLHPLPALPLAVPLPLLPDITPWVDPIKGIEPHRDTQAFQRAFEELDRSLLQVRPPGPLPAPQQALLRRQVELTGRLIDENPFLASGSAGTLEKIKNRLRQRADRDSAKQAAARLLSPAWLAGHAWEQERRFWRQQVLPLVASNYWRSLDENGRPTDHFWRLDLLLFQSVFALDILLRAIRLRRRLPGLSWRDALLRRWIDLPLLLPCWRWLRVVPVVERLQTSGLINIEPLRAVVSRAVVALLALELVEVLALQLLDGLQSLVRSRRWPERLRRLRSHQSVAGGADEQDVVELLRIWAPLLLSRVLPQLAPELQNLLSHALRQSLDRSVVPAPLRQLQPLLQVERGVSRQLAAGVVEQLLDLVQSAGERLALRDDQLLQLLQRCVDRFWEELAAALEREGALERSQALLVALLEELKTTYLGQINRSGIEALMEELDQITSEMASRDGIVLPDGGLPPGRHGGFSRQGTPGPAAAPATPGA